MKGPSIKNKLFFVISLSFGLILIFSVSVFADVVKKTKTEVTFKGFGTFSKIQTEKILPEKKLTNSESEFKGKGILGKTAGKMLLRSGQFGEIIDLSSKVIYSMDHKKKEYTENPLEKIADEEFKEEAEKSEEEEEELEAEEREDNIKIIRSEFKVVETGESKVINQFDSRKYIITWLTEWENIQSGEKGTDRLETEVWTTPFSGEIKQYYEEEQKFFSNYMKEIGLDADSLQKQILGTQWFSLLSGMGRDSGKLSDESTGFSKEMKKIKGYPVVIDGRYYTVREGEEKEEESNAVSVKGMLGKFAKKAVAKKTAPKTQNEPSLSYYIELMDYSSANLSPEEFQVPSDYKKK